MTALASRVLKGAHPRLAGSAIVHFYAECVIVAMDVEPDGGDAVDNRVCDQLAGQEHDIVEAF